MKTSHCRAAEAEHCEENVGQFIKKSLFRSIKTWVVCRITKLLSWFKRQTEEESDKTMDGIRQDLHTPQEKFQALPKK